MDLKIILIFFVIITLVIYTKNIYESKNNIHKKHINKLVRQAARWSVAAQQDESPIIALLHANYGAGFLWALRDIASDQEIEEATGINVPIFVKKITDVQDGATKRVSKACPQFVGDLDKYLLTLGGDA